MKGIVFTEFLSFVEREMGPDMTDQIIEDCASELSTGGAYTSVGTYPCAEMGALLGALARRSGAPAPTLLRSFGEALAGTFATTYPHYFAQADDLFGFVSRIDSYIHVEVRKLYPDAELPTFDVISHDADRMVLTYRSPRALHDLAMGLFLASAAHYRERVEVEMTLHPEPGSATFALTRLAQ